MRTWLIETRSLESKQRNAVIEEMSQQFENDPQPEGLPYTVFADHLTDHATFIQSLRSAGFQIRDEHVIFVPFHARETVVVTFASGAHAKWAMLALHLREFEGMHGKKMCLAKASLQVAGPDERSPCAPLPSFDAVTQALGQAFSERAGARRADEERRRSEEARLTKETKDAKKAENRARHLKRIKEARRAKHAKKAANIKAAEEVKKRMEEAKLAKQRKNAANIKAAEEAKGVKKAESRASHLKRIEEDKRAKQARKSANIKAAQEAKLAKDTNKAVQLKRVEEKRLKQGAIISAQRNGDCSAGSEGKLNIVAIAPEEPQNHSGGFEDMDDIEAIANHEPEVSAWLGAMRQRHRDRGSLEAAWLG